VKPGDIVTLKARSKDTFPVVFSLDTSVDRAAPEWLEINTEERKITISDLPSRAQIDVPVQEQLIVELYSK
jgi:small subunit ribosomal protein S4